MISEALELAKSAGVEMPVCRFVRHLIKTLEQVNAAALVGPSIPAFETGA